MLVWIFYLYIECMHSGFISKYICIMNTNCHFHSCIHKLVININTTLVSMINASSLILKNAMCKKTYPELINKTQKRKCYYSRV